mmetsp:Transcript_42660/g.68723  ORF Transcript_42660/g.68723 Transcript_42660/m.68723 type:complete len:190 (-) Transcript_42660:275-844(-)
MPTSSFLSSGRLKTTTLMLDDCKFSLGANKNLAKKHRGFIVIKASNDKFLGVTSEGGVDAQEKVLEKCLFRLRIATKTKKKKKKKEDSKRQSEPVTEQPSGLESAAGMLDDVEYPLAQSTLLESGKQQGELLEGGEGGKAVTDSLLGNRKYCCCCNCCYLNFGSLVTCCCSCCLLESKDSSSSAKPYDD